MKSMMGIASPTGSHLPLLEAEVLAAPLGSLVIEHGAGLYSTPLLARIGGKRVFCSEPHAGWAEWAEWIYAGTIDAVVGKYDDAIKQLSNALLVFIDGPAKERVPLLLACLEANVPVVIMHDTGRHDWRHYGLKPHHFEHELYEVTHHAEDSHRTTMWKLRQ